MLNGGEVFGVLLQDSATDQLRFGCLILSQKHGNQVGFIDDIAGRCIQGVADELRSVFELLSLESDQAGQMPCFRVRGVFLQDLQVRGGSSVRVTGNMALVPISEPALNACGRHGSSLKLLGGNSCRYRTARLIRARSPGAHLLFTSTNQRLGLVLFFVLRVNTQRVSSQ
jgi:hypothetical protein